MSMNHNEDLRQIHVVDLYVRMAYNRVNLLFVVCSIPIDPREDHHHLESKLHVSCNHLLNNHRIVVHIVYMSCNVRYQSRHLMHHEHRQEVNVIQKVLLNNHRQDRVVGLEQAHGQLEQLHQSKENDLIKFNR